jgi:hypothetical protein
MYCAKCGNELKDGAQFCSACGEPQTVKNGGGMNVPPKQSYEPAKFAPPEKTITAPAAMATPHATTPIPKKKRKLPLIIAGSAGGAVLVALLVVFLVIPHFFGGISTLDALHSPISYRFTNFANHGLVTHHEDYSYVVVTSQTNTIVNDTLLTSRIIRFKDGEDAKFEEIYHGDSSLYVWVSHLVIYNDKLYFIERTGDSHFESIIKWVTLDGGESGATYVQNEGNLDIGDIDDMASSPSGFGNGCYFVYACRYKINVETGDVEETSYEEKSKIEFSETPESMDGSIFDESWHQEYGYRHQGVTYTLTEDYPQENEFILEREVDDFLATFTAFNADGSSNGTTSVVNDNRVCFSGKWFYNIEDEAISVVDLETGNNESYPLDLLMNCANVFQGKLFAFLDDDTLAEFNPENGKTTAIAQIDDGGGKLLNIVDTYLYVHSWIVNKDDSATHIAYRVDLSSSNPELELLYDPLKVADTSGL